MNLKNYNLVEYNNILNACIGIFNKLKLGKIIYLELIYNQEGVIKVTLKNELDKLYYFITDEFGEVIEAREGSLQGNVIYSSKEVESNHKEDSLMNSDYIRISSSGHFSKNKINSCLVSLNENKIYNITFDNNGKDKYVFYKEMSNEQKNKLLSYINANDLLNANINILVFDASDIIEISISGKKNIIRNASKQFTNNETHIFDDIVNIVFNSENNTFNKIKNFFSFDLKNDNEIIKFAKEHGYNGAKYIGEWKEYKVYEPYIDEKNTSYSGLPLVILVNKNGEIRMSTSDEAMATSNDKSFIESFDRNKIKEELNFSNRQEAINAYINKFGDFPLELRDLPEEIVIEKIKDALRNNVEISGFMRKYKIDENGHEYEEINTISIPKCIDCKEMLLLSVENKNNYFCPKCKKKYFNKNGVFLPINDSSQKNLYELIDDINSRIGELEAEQNKIDKEIQSNFEEVSKYSILNKTIEELLSAKKKFINDWYIMLFNTNSEHWIMNSSTYRVHLASIIDAILRRSDDSISKQQLELINSITENKYFGNKDKDSVIKIVKLLKELESKLN